MYREIIDLICNTLNYNEYSLQEIETNTSIKRRLNGESFSLENHIEGLVFALLSNQRPWKQISDNYVKIKDIFHNFDPNYLKSVNPSVLINDLRNIKCGNISINSQMNTLGYNIDVFNNIIGVYGSMDNYVTSDNPYVIAMDLSSGKYKIKQLGIALAMEYLKNVGIDVIKPDLHIRRLFGSERLSFSNKTNASEDEVIEIVKAMSLETGLLCSEIDSIIWQFCASNYGEICTANPKCNNCLVRSRCNYKKK